MVSSLGGIPLANPLQNPVLTGLGQYYNAIYSPLQMMAQPLQALAMANMYGDRGMYYTDQGQLAAQKAGQIQQGYGTDAAGQTAYTLANQQGSPAAQQYLSSVAAQPGAQVGVDLSRVPLIQAQQQLAMQNQQLAANNAAKSAQETTNIGGMPAVANPYMVGGNQNAMPQQGNSPGQMQQLQTQLGQLSGTSDQPQAPMYATQMQPTDFLKAAATGNPNPPPLPPGTPLNPATGKLMNQLDSSQQFNDKLNNLIQNASNPAIQPYIGKDFSVAGGRRILGDVTSGLTGQSSPAFTQYQQMIQSGALSGEGLANIASPGTRAWNAIHANMNMLDPTKVPSSGVYVNNLKNIANMQQQDLMSIVQGNYTPAVRQRAWQQLQYTTKLPGFQQQQQAQQAAPQTQQQSSVFQSPDFQSAIAAELKSRGS